MNNELVPFSAVEKLMKSLVLAVGVNSSRKFFKSGLAIGTLNFFTSLDISQQDDIADLSPAHEGELFAVA
jgi:hypothetical protein